ncbi:MAG: hypothetical protein LBL46_02135, partial [Rickettsiales bacterium]|nr:hypothetical protein [Rickettsiales bacterium]
MKTTIYALTAALMISGANAADNAADEIKAGYSSSYETARSKCAGISDGVSALKVAAGISTGAAAVGMVAGGVAATAGFIKLDYDKKKAAEKNAAVKDFINFVESNDQSDNQRMLAIAKKITSEDAAQPTPTDAKSQFLGNVRTAGAFASGGTQGVAAVSSFIGIGGIDKLAADMEACTAAVREIDRQKTELQFAAPDDAMIPVMQKIVDGCKGLNPQNITDVKNKLAAAGIITAIGGAAGIAGGIASAIAVGNEKKGADPTKSDKGGTA